MFLPSITFAFHFGSGSVKSILSGLPSKRTSTLAVAFATVVAWDDVELPVSGGTLIVRGSLANDLFRAVFVIKWVVDHNFVVK